MLREQITQSLREATKAKDARRLSTVRLIVAALKDRDIAARTRPDGGVISDDEILQMLQSMIKQRRESIGLYEQGGRADLAKQEQDEIGIIESFMPRQLSEAEIRSVSQAAISEVGATGIKDMGRTMTALKQRYAGRMDFARAAGIVKELLS